MLLPTGQPHPRKFIGKDVNSLSLFECQCVCFERLLCSVLCVLADFCLHVIGLRAVWMRHVVICVDILTVIFVLYLAIASTSILFLSVSTCSSCVHTFNQLFLRRLRSVDGFYCPVLPEAIVTPGLSVSVSNEVLHAAQWRSHALSVDGSGLGGGYSIVIPRGR